MTTALEPSILMRPELYVTAAALSSGLFVILVLAGMAIWPAAILAGIAGFVLRGAAIALVTAGRITVAGRGGKRSLRPGEAVFITQDESPVQLDGDGEVFVAQPGRAG